MISRTIAEMVKGRPLLSVAAGATVDEACDVLNAADIGALPVVDGGRLVGILSERDVIRRAICRRLPTWSTEVSVIMTPDPIIIDVDASLTEAVRTMRDARVRHLPVTRDGMVMAILSMRDIPVVYRLMAERRAQVLNDDPGGMRRAN